MNIIHPNGPMRGVDRESCFLIRDDAGVELGQGSILIKPVMDVLPERPLNIILDLDAHPSAMDMLYGALMVRARMIHKSRGGAPARIVVPCALTDTLKHDYFLSVGFDDTDGEELFRFVMPERLREMPPPFGTVIEPVVLRLSGDTDALIMRMDRYTGETWNESRFENAMNTSHFMALALYSGNELCGEIVVSGEGPDAMIEALYTFPKWRRQGVALALLSQALEQLRGQGVQYVYARAIRRNKRAMAFIERTGFEWVMSRQILLGKDLNRPGASPASRPFADDPFTR